MSNVLTTKRAVFALQTRKSINMGASNIQSEIAPGKLGAMLADGSAVVGYHADDTFASLHLGKVLSRVSAILPLLETSIAALHGLKGSA